MSIKKLFIAAIIALPMGAHAETVDKETYCALVGKMAAAAMEYRQKGYALNAVLESSSNIRNESMRSLFKKMAVDAYAKPSFMGAELQQRSIVDYAAKMQTACYGAVKDKAGK